MNSKQRRKARRNDEAIAASKTPEQHEAERLLRLKSIEEFWEKENALRKVERDLEWEAMKRKNPENPYAED